MYRFSGQMPLIDQETRLRAFMEEYARAASMFDDVAGIRQTLTRLEFLLILLVAEVGVAFVISALIILCRAMCYESSSSPPFENNNTNEFVGERSADHQQTPKVNELPSIS
ncbi:hypothetical protein AB6A40_004880 [Gnathostoma spinigerum]|uniref:Uncharacterized protein n=1 Tax=Gnathostoma spinigerum TaxID=75299 RepID=A0ABD6EEU2_9BILA